MAGLLSPLQIKGMKLSNRLVMPPMATTKAGENGEVSQELLHYYDEKCRGGYLGLVIIEHSFISPEGKASERQLSVSRDEDIPGLRTLAKTIQKNGSKAIVQINHAGSGTTAEVIKTTPLGPSPVANPRKGTIPRELDAAEIKKIVADFQKAAARVKEAGFDGVEIHSAHSYLLNQFFSPITNKREDAYGGSLDNRIKLHLEVIAAVREAVGRDFPLFLRLGCCDYLEGGTTLEDSKSAAREFARAGVDVIDVSGGVLGYNAPGNAEEGYFAPLSEAIKKVVEIPVIVTGGIKTAAKANQIIAEGKADLVGVGRALLQDSLWAKKAVESLR